MAQIARDLVGVMLGEAGGKTPAQRYRDMLGIASVVANRAAQTGVSVQDVISAMDAKGRKQFDAYGKALPAGVEKFSDLARMAIDQVSKWGPVNNATFYSTPAAVSNLPTGLKAEDKTVAHQYFSDPKNRAIRTATGFVTPDPDAMAMGYAPAVSNNPAQAALAEMSSPQAVRSNLADVSYSLGPNRPNKPSQNTVDIARSAVADTLGPGYSVSVFSGMENPGGQYGSNRHRTGLAADVHITDPTGRTLNTTRDRNQMVDVAHAMAAKGATGIGIGTNYMGGTGIHVDTFSPGPGQDNAWGNLGNANQAMLVDAMKTATMPASFYDKMMPAQMAVPGVAREETAIAQATPVQSMSVPGTPDIAPDTNIGFFAGQPGKVAGAPSQSVKTASVTPNMSVASVDGPQQSFAGTPQSTAADALSALAGDDEASNFSEVAGTPVGTNAYATTNLPDMPSAPAVAPTNAYATTNLPSVAPSVNPALEAAVAPALPAPTTITPRPVAVPKVTAPTISAPQTRAPAQSMPSGVQAAMDFHAGLNNAAVASNGNTLTRDALGNSYNYSPSFDVTTISDPTGRTVGVKQGKVTPDMAGASATATSTPSTSKGLFSGIGDTLGGIFSGDNVSNAVVGGLGGLGGAAVGSLLGPVGSMVGSAIGRSLAVQHNPFASRQPGTFTVNTFQGPMTFASPVAGLGGLGGFPSAPRGAPGALGGTQSNRSAGEMRGMSPGAADAIGRGVGGLY